MAKEIEKWITVNGRHVPVYKGESADAAIKRSVTKQEEEQKAKDIAKNKQAADRASGKSENDKSVKKSDIIDELVKKYQLKPGENRIPVAKIRTDLQQLMENNDADWTDDDYYSMLGTVVLKV